MEALSDPEMVVKQAKKVYNDLDAQTSEVRIMQKLLVFISIQVELEYELSQNVYWKLYFLHMI